jgi:hypothetical protein
MSQGLIRYNQEPEEIATELYRILTNSDYKKNLLANLWETFSSMYSNPESNFGNVLAKVAGLGSLRSQTNLDIELYPVCEESLSVER